MKIEEIVELTQGRLLNGQVDRLLEISYCGAADLMSDVLAFVRAGSLLITGLATTQTVRTVEMADIRAVVFVRGKVPGPETTSLAQELGIPLIASPLGMYEVCGRLYQAGLIPVRRLHQELMSRD
ncbi:MAG: transcriptional regulator [Deltaproteobacteria bacterium]|nr:transcriptional regulator [Deltaproteobacteria bacterium]